MCQRVVSMADQPAYSSKTPCVGLCSTVYGDQVCRGCKRFSHEIVDWNRYDSDARAAVWLRLEQLLEQVISARVELVSSVALNQALERFAVSVDNAMPLSMKVLRLLGRLGDESVEVAGMRLRGPWAQMPTRQLRDDVDSVFFALSQAYYDRRMPPAE